MCLSRILFCSILKQAENETSALEQKVADAKAKLNKTRAQLTKEIERCGMLVVCAAFAQRCGVHSGLDAQMGIISERNEHKEIVDGLQVHICSLTAA